MIYAGHHYDWGGIRAELQHAVGLRAPRSRPGRTFARIFQAPMETPTARHVRARGAFGVEISERILHNTARLAPQPQDLESSELVRQAYGYELFTNPVEPVVKRAAMLL